MKDLRLRPYAEGALYHHEALNGTGYPQGLKKEDIPLVIDAFKSFENESNLLEETGILSSLLNDKTCVAIGWQSSITDMWDNYDIFTEKKHWSLLDEINAIQKVINDEKDVEYDA